MMFSIKDFFSKCDQTGRKLRIWSHLLKISIKDFTITTGECIGHVQKRFDSRLRTLNGNYARKNFLTVKELDLGKEG